MVCISLSLSLTPTDFVKDSESYLFGIMCYNMKSCIRIKVQSMATVVVSRNYLGTLVVSIFVSLSISLTESRASIRND